MTEMRIHPVTPTSTIPTSAADRILLPASEMPRHWYNVMADMPYPVLPPLSPATMQPAGPEDLGRIFPPGLLEQEMSSERYIAIPDEVLEILAQWRPTPLIRARNLERALDTPARIYFKYEVVSPTGSHKPNTAVPQAYYNKIAGIDKLVTETGAGQWGSSLAFATRAFGMTCRVFMVKVSYDQKPYRRSLMRLYGAEVFPSPSPLTAAGRAILAEHSDSPGSLGIAISEAVEEAAKNKDTNYALGSVLNHVLLHQTVIGQEAKKQLAIVDETPDYVIACHGGGSNFGGLALPFVSEVASGEPIEVIAAEPASCPTLTKGTFAYDYGDTAKLTPLVQMFTLGHGFVPPPVHAGGLRYHGASPLVSTLVANGAFRAESVGQVEVFRAAELFAHAEGIVPAPESAHAIAVAIRKALQLKQEHRQATILFGLSGHGFFDMSAYEAYLDGQLEDHELPENEIAQALAELPSVPR